MFGEVAKLFDRNFAIGYALPVALWLGATYAIGIQVSSIAAVAAWLDSISFTGITVLGIIVWLCGALLLSLNFPLIRLLEGYGAYHPAQLLGGQARQRRRYRQLKQGIDTLYDEIERDGRANKPVSSDAQKCLVNVLRQMAEQYPHDEIYLLPTRFGNAVRAFEVYPNVMYGAEAVTVWDRLLGVIPKEYYEFIATAKANVDFWVNLLVLSVLVLIESCVVLGITGNLTAIWQPCVALSIAVFAYIQLPNAAIAWGDTIRAAFDLYLPALAKQLRFDVPLTADAKRNQWTTFSQAITFRNADLLPPRISAVPAETLAKAADQDGAPDKQ